eukprot:g19131.t1
MGADSPQSTFTAVSRPSGVLLRVSVAFALLSACYGWVLSGGYISNVFRAVKGAPWKNVYKAQDECRAAPAWDADLSDIREAVQAFDARSYTPPVWARNAHLHTIVASGDMEKKLLGDRTPLGYWRERWPTPDGDFIDIDWLSAEKIAKDDPKDKSSASDAAAATVAGEEQTFDVHMDMEGTGNGPSGVSAAVVAETDNIEELREMAVLAEHANDNNLGIGHPEAPEPIHEDDPSWMAERSRGQGGQGTGGTRRLVLVLHGLEGSSTAPLTKRFSSVFTRNGFDVAALNFRGCSGEHSRYPVGYHLGFTDDLLHVIEEIHRRFPGTWDRIYLSGFSLGGNVIVKFLGEQGDRARELGIYGAAVGCVPFEPKIAAEKLEKDIIGRQARKRVRRVYMPVFMSWMKIKAEAHARAYPDKLSMETVDSVKTFTQFNSRITSPLFDFSSLDEFYDHVNAANYLSRVRVPLIVVNAKDDPFIDSDSLPEQERVEDAPVRLEYHTYGGHCGFISNVLQGKTPKHLRKWGPPWGGSWVPWASRGDPETLAHEGDNNAGTVGAAATATAAAAAAALAAKGAPASIHDAPMNLEDGGGGSMEGKDGREGISGQKAGGATLKEGRWLPTELARFITHLDESLHKDGRSERPGARAGAAASADACVVRSPAWEACRGRFRG